MHEVESWISNFWQGNPYNSTEELSKERKALVHEYKLIYVAIVDRGEWEEWGSSL